MVAIALSYGKSNCFGSSSKNVTRKHQTISYRTIWCKLQTEEEEKESEEISLLSTEVLPPPNENSIAELSSVFRVWRICVR